MDIDLQENFLHIAGAKTIKQSLVTRSNFLENITADTDCNFFKNNNTKELFFSLDELEYVDLLISPKDYDECEFYDAIYFFENKKNNFRCIDKQHFEYYDKLQELFYKKMELVYPNEKDEVIPDSWNKPL
jgi:Ran GTPase-activating protein (RanGAP) involved in mRNA processing and transport